MIQRKAIISKITTYPVGFLFSFVRPFVYFRLCFILICSKELNKFFSFSNLDRSILPDAYPSRSNSSILHPDLSRALRVDAHLLAIVRIEDRRSLSKKKKKKNVKFNVFVLR